MRTAIYGAGSLGTILGAFIAKAGMPIELINRNKAHVEALNANAAHVVGTMEFTQKVTAYTPDQMSGTYDVIFLMTKQQNNKEVVTMLKDYLAPDGVLVTFQNGLPEMQIADILGEERVLGCTVAWGATMQGPGVCELTSEPDALSFSLGSISANTGVAPTCRIVLAEAANVSGVVMTSSPGQITALPPIHTLLPMVTGSAHSCRVLRSTGSVL